MSTSVSIQDGIPQFTSSVGGLATGLSSMHEREGSLWIGWSGVPDDTLTDAQRETISRRLHDEHGSVAVPLTSEEIDSFYLGFCNKIVWPLFHYFPTYVDYDEELWNRYQAVNRKFFDYLAPHVEPGDYVWVHDYQLMLLPALIKEHQPDTKLGFFLHIPFPSYEVFRLLPWREELLEGLLGADLVGFHTYDYARHFLSSVRRLLGHDHRLASITYHTRVVKVDVFPMGIDYDKYSSAGDVEAVKQESQAIAAQQAGRKLVLSVDRLDYSKGILERLRAFREFLALFPEMRRRVDMIMIVAPSRTSVPHYQELKREVDELVSSINGEYGAIDWVPIRYFFRTMPFDKLTALYRQADVLLVTPLRDGMNLIAKEYIAARADLRGVLVLSETAGAARELAEALIVNPSNAPQIAHALKTALEMPLAEQRRRNRSLHQRLRRYNIHSWAADFMEKLDAAVTYQQQFLVKRLNSEARANLLRAYTKADAHLIVLDYDGTLVPYADDPAHAEPDADLLKTLRALSEPEENDVVLVCSRGKEFMQQNLGSLPIGLVASHGIDVRTRDGKWQTSVVVDAAWKAMIAPVLQLYADRTPGARFEEKEYSLAWHYQRSEPELAAVRVAELKDALLSLTSNLDVTLVEGARVLEVKSSHVSKTAAVRSWLKWRRWPFVLVAGDDTTDEEVFAAVGASAYCIRVGLDATNAGYFTRSTDSLREFLQQLSGEDR